MVFFSLFESLKLGALWDFFLPPVGQYDSFFIHIVTVFSLIASREQNLKNTHCFLTVTYLLLNGLFSNLISSQYFSALQAP